jgi:hypothetical protein
MTSVRWMDDACEDCGSQLLQVEDRHGELTTYGYELHPPCEPGGRTRGACEACLWAMQALCREAAGIRGQLVVDSGPYYFVVELRSVAA